MTLEEAQPAPQGGRLLVRVLSALVLLPIVLGALWAGYPYFTILIAACGVIMAIEWTGLVQIPGWTAALHLVPAAMIFTLPYGLTIESALAVVAVLTGLPLAVGLIFGRRALVWVGLGLVYVWLPLTLAAWMRDLEHGLVVILWLLLVVWLTDIGGYFAGKGIGGPKLAPRLSPKKTWAGLFGGMALAALGGAIVSLALDFGQAAMMATLSAGLAIVEQISDLLESGIKRRFGAKDSGHLIPGHGGLLDRVDGIVLVAASVGLAVLFNPQWGIA